MNILEKGRGFIVKKWFQKTMSLLICAAMLLSASSGATPVLAEALVQEATSSEAECTHPNARIVSFNKDAGVEDNSSDSLHIRLTDVYEKWVCPDCNKEGEETFKETLREEEKHNYQNGVCTVCSHVCNHERKPYGDPIEESPSSSWVPYDNEQHTRSVTAYQTWVCSYCDAMGQTYLDPETRYERHTFNENGFCTVCGFQCMHNFSDNVCTICGFVCNHSNKNVWYGDKAVEGSLQSVDAMYHNGQFGHYEFWNCPTCAMNGETLLSAQPFTSMHNYNENQDCLDCGFHNPCEHPNKSEWDYDNFDNPWVDDGNGRTHSTTVTRMSGWRCPDCGVSQTRSSTEATRTSLHEYSDGKCVGCGAAETCTHSILIHQEEKYEGDWHDDGNGLTHSRSAKRVLNAICGICGADVQQVLEENIAQTENHQTGEKTICKVCNATIGCPHTNVYYGIEYRSVGEEWGVDNGDGTHTLRKRVVNVELCKDCGDKQVTETDEILTVTDPHILDRDGHCINCSYKKPCEHLNTVQKGFIYFGDTYLPNDDGKTHYRYERVMAKLACTDCGATDVGSVPVTPTQRVTADHEYDYRGVCRYCGYVKPADEVCKHEHTKAIYYDEGMHTLSKNATGHVMISDYMEEVLCTDCGTQVALNVVKKDFISTGMHEFASDGVCYVCGYQREKDIVNQPDTCKHEHTVVETQTVRTLEVVKRDDNGHVIKAVVADVTVCDDCGERLTETNVRNEEVTEGHRFGYDGKCVGCGYMNPCKHTHVHEENGVAYWNSVRVEDDNTHSYMAFFVEGKVCDDCGENLGETLRSREPERITEYHDYDENGICVVCGVSKPEETPAPTATPAPASTSSSGNSGNNNTRDDNNFVPTPVPTATPEPTVSTETRQAFDVMDAFDRTAAQSQNVQIEIVGMETVMSEENLARVQRLPVKEQLLMILAAADCGTVSKSIMSTMELTLSNSSDALFKELNKATATDQDRQTVENRLTELFPVHVIMRDNVYYHVHVMTVKMTVDGVEQTYYFGLRLDEFGLWQMIELNATEVGEDTLVQK